MKLNFEVEVNNLDDLVKITEAEKNHKEASFLKRQEFWYPVMASSAIIGATVAVTVGILKLFGLL